VKADSRRCGKFMRARPTYLLLCSRSSPRGLLLCARSGPREFGSVRAGGPEGLASARVGLDAASFALRANLLLRQGLACARPSGPPFPPLPFGSEERARTRAPQGPVAAVCHGPGRPMAYGGHMQARRSTGARPNARAGPKEHGCSPERARRPEGARVLARTRAQARRSRCARPNVRTARERERTARRRE
jgi:hypothetical protein